MAWLGADLSLKPRACFLTVGILVSKHRYDGFVLIGVLQRSTAALGVWENKCLFKYAYIHTYIKHIFPDNVKEKIKNERQLHF